MSRTRSPLLRLTLFVSLAGLVASACTDDQESCLTRVYVKTQVLLTDSSTAADDRCVGKVFLDSIGTDTTTGTVYYRLDSIGTDTM